MFRCIQHWFPGTEIDECEETLDLNFDDYQADIDAHFVHFTFNIKKGQAGPEEEPKTAGPLDDETV